MAENIIEQIEILSQAFSAQLVMLDVSSQEGIKEFLSQYQQIADLARVNRLSAIEKVAALCHEYANAAFLKNDKVLFKKTLSFSAEILSKQIAYEKDKTGLSIHPDWLIRKFKEIDLPQGETAQVHSFSDSQLREMPDFIAHAKTIIEATKKEIAQTVNHPDHKDYIQALLRVFHGIKGQARILGLVNISDLCCEVEILLDRLKSKKINFSVEMPGLILEALDLLNNLLDLLKNNPEEALNGDIGRYKAKIDNLIIHGDKKSVVTDEFSPKIPVLDFSYGREVIEEFISESREHMTSAEEALLKLENDPQDPEQINKALRDFHTVKGLASFLNLDDLRVLTHDTEAMMDMVRRATLPFTHEISEAALASIDAIRKLLDLLSEQVANNGRLESAYFDAGPVDIAIRNIVNRVTVLVVGFTKSKLGELLIEKGIITETDLNKALDKQKKEILPKKIGEILVEERMATVSQIKRALDDQYKGDTIEASIKIPVAKLDSLIEMAGKLVVTSAQISGNPHVKSFEDKRFFDDMQQLGRIVQNIHDVSMSLRMVAIKPVFQKMTRLIHDLSRKMNKDVEVRISGDELKIDKNLVDLLGDPLLHMVRNCLDHGLESPQERLEKGKPAKGIISLSAYQRSGNIVIEVKDDGRGINKDKILKKAIENGLLREGEQVDENRLFQLMFIPGFSTVDKVTDLSGRGVGMDVVRENIEQLKGKIEVISEEGKGSIFLLELPLKFCVPCEA
ncbi:MAG: Hpt domain-containing protein [Candidatus Omnitrophica bacterium]|jgi:two-component system chemotaxis sensor kinase CheA|nr:Hpt domain-containing protein [Candidatus Omnitrophota bacterium]